MTNKIAIEYLKDMLASAEANLHVPDMAEHAEALDMAIEALSKSQKQTDSLIRASADDVSEADVIYRQNAIDAANRADYRGLAVEDVRNVTDEVVKELKQLPSAQPTLRERALMLLLNWAEECGFGYDNFPEEYERYKDEIVDMSYLDGMIYIAEKEVENNG